MEKKNKLIQVVLSLFIFIGFFIIANHLKRTETIPLLLTYSSIFILLFIGLKNSSSLISIFILGILDHLDWDSCSATWMKFKGLALYVTL